MSWEAQKENIQPIAQGRKIGALMEALSLVTDNKAKAKLITDRKVNFETDLEEAKDDLNKQLDLWFAYIDWLEQHEPEGGKVNGLTNAIEQCIEQFYSRNEFKQDQRLFDIFMKFKRFCDDPVEVFGFMYANSIGTLLANFYLNWSWQYEMKKNMKRAQDLLKLGLKNLATPQDVLKEALEQIKFRLNRMIQAGELDECPENGTSSNREIQAELASGGIRAALQTLKCRATKKQGLRAPISRVGGAIEETNVGGLKSQTHIVNGVRVAKKGPSKSRLPGKPNRAILVLPETDENAPAPTDENAPALAIMDKIPTSTKIQMVGRSGAENFAPTRGVIKASNRPMILRD